MRTSSIVCALAFGVEESKRNQAETDKAFINK